MPFEWVTRLEGAPERSGALSPDGRPADTNPDALWSPPTYAAGSPPAAELQLWPNRSLPQGGFVIVIALTASLLALPLLALLGRPELWVILPFMLVTLAGLWLAFRRNYASGKLIEQLRLWPDRLEIHRFEPGGRQLDWHAHPHWTRLSLHEEGGPVEHYLTLQGNGREVELGAFLSPEERVALKAEIEGVIRRLG